MGVSHSRAAQASGSMEVGQAGRDGESSPSLVRMGMGCCALEERGRMWIEHSPPWYSPTSPEDLMSAKMAELAPSALLLCFGHKAWCVWGQSALSEAWTLVYC